MKNFQKFSALFCFVLISMLAAAQNETSKWYFGTYAGLDFATTPPTILTNGMLNTSEGCESMSDAAGNLLLYTDGSRIFDKNHNPMMNGAGLTGNPSTTQSGMILKQPGSSNIYYVFSLGASGMGTLACSTVDMNLAAGMGSVTIKNSVLSTGMSEKLTAAQHCNGRDLWVVAHSNNSNDFMSFLVSASGVSSTAVLSSAGSTLTQQNIQWAGNMKISPNGRKLAMALGGATGSFEVFDFDNSTGMVSNPVNLGTFPAAYGCEFSPDGSKLYGCRELGTDFLYLFQWNLCAGSPAAIIASQYTLAVPSQLMGMQLASNGKIYIARGNETSLAVIHSPNASGAACNYVHNGQSIAPRTCNYNLPNFMTSYFRPAPLPFTYTISCNMGAFDAPSISNTINAGCGSVLSTPTNVLWNFDDPSSGSSNSSTLLSPSHAFTTPGTYSVQMVSYRQCSSDTTWSIVTITTPAPGITVSGNFSICYGERVTYTVSGASAYTWYNGAHTTTISLSPLNTSTYNVSGTNGNSCRSTNEFTITVSKCTGIETLSSGEEKGIRIYPNPNTGILNIETEKPIQITVLNSLGKIMSVSSFEAGTFTLDLKAYESGIYTVKSVSKSGTKIMRLVKTE